MKRTFLAGILALMILLLALPGVVSAADLKVEGSILPPAPVADFSITATNGLAPITVSFTDTSTPVGYIDSWKWEYRIADNGAWTEFGSGAQNPTGIVFSNPGTYDIRLTVSNSVGSNTKTVTHAFSAAMEHDYLITVGSGTVSGDLFVDSVSPWTTSATQTFTLPGAAVGNVQWARLYVNTYGGSAAGDYGHLSTVTFDGTTIGTETCNIKSTTTGIVFPVNDHVMKVYSDYEAVYDVSSHITTATPTVTVTDTAINGLTLDGRIKGITLVVAYNDGDSDVVRYIVNHGNDWMGPAGATSSTAFDASSFTSGWTSATMKTVAHSGTDGSYTLNGGSITKTTLLSGSYIKYNQFDLTSVLNAGTSNTFGYTAVGSSFKICTAALTAKYAAPTADFSATPTSVDRGQEVTFTDASTGATGWEWDFDNNGVVDSTAQNPTYIYTTVGMKTVKLTVTGPTGTATETKADYITVKEPAPVIDFTPTSASGPRPLTVNFAGTNTGGLVTSWAWDFGDSTGTGQSISHTYQTAGTYTVTLTATGPDYTDTETKTNIITVGDSSIAVTVTDASIPFGTMTAGETKTGSRTVNVDVTGGTAWYVTAADNDAVTKGYMATATDVKLANPFQLSKTGTAGTFQDMTTNFADFLTGSAGSDGSGTAYVQQVIGADAPGAYSITLTFTGGFN
jgi:PKD repeat protein